MEPVSEPSKIFEYLFLGDDLKSQFQERQENKNLGKLDFECQVIDLKDIPTQNIFQFFEMTHEFILSARERGCLVVCSNGNSRAATICIAHIMKVLDIGVEAACDFVRTQRPSISPNEGFLKQLHDLYEQLHPPTPTYFRSFSVMQYNILGENYATKKSFPYCSEDSLKFSRRAKIIVEQISQLKPDIICLQELDRYDWFKPRLEEVGYDGVFHKRPGDKNDGCGTFFQTKLFNQEGNWCIEYKDKTKHIGQILKLSFTKPRGKRSRDNFLFICNTHLYWDTDQPHIQLSQIQSLLLALETHNPEQSISIICGDFNASPDQIPYHYMINTPEKNKQNPKLSNFSINSPFLPFQSAYSNYFGSGQHPPFSAYQEKWHGWVDYIWYWGKDQEIGVQELYPLPSILEVSKDVGLPNMVFPSDHLPIMAKFGYT